MSSSDIFFLMRLLPSRKRCRAIVPEKPSRGAACDDCNMLSVVPTFSTSIGCMSISRCTASDHAYPRASRQRGSINLSRPPRHAGHGSSSAPGPLSAREKSVTSLNSRSSDDDRRRAMGTGGSVRLMRSGPQRSIMSTTRTPRGPSGADSRERRSFSECEARRDRYAPNPSNTSGSRGGGAGDGEARAPVGSTIAVATARTSLRMYIASLRVTGRQLHSMSSARPSVRRSVSAVASNVGACGPSLFVLGGDPWALSRVADDCRLSVWCVGLVPAPVPVSASGVSVVFHCARSWMSIRSAPSRMSGHVSGISLCTNETNPRITSSLRSGSVRKKPLSAEYAADRSSPSRWIVMRARSSTSSDSVIPVGVRRGIIARHALNRSRRRRLSPVAISANGFFAYAAFVMTRDRPTCPSSARSVWPSDAISFGWYVISPRFCAVMSSSESVTGFARTTIEMPDGVASVIMGNGGSPSLRCRSSTIAWNARNPMIMRSGAVIVLGGAFAETRSNIISCIARSILLLAIE
eukprot:Opistho-2@58931